MTVLDLIVPAIINNHIYNTQEILFVDNIYVVKKVLLCDSYTQPTMQSSLNLGTLGQNETKKLWAAMRVKLTVRLEAVKTK